MLGAGTAVEKVVEYILEGLEGVLELERELGVRTVEIDRSVLGARCVVSGEKAIVPAPRTPHSALRTQHSALSTQHSAPSTPHSAPDANLVFLHDRPLSPGGVEMMAKILNALGEPEAPIVIVPPVPKARVTVVLGGLALKRYFPSMRGEPGQWQKTSDGRDVLITYSPEYILRFGAVTPAVERIKRDMWRSLKAVKQRLLA